MDVQVTQTRDLSTDELEILKQALNEARANKLNNRIQIATSNIRTGAWMLVNKFVTVVSDHTGKSTVEFFAKGTKIAGAIAVTTAAASLVSPVTAPGLSTVAGVAGAATIGGVIAQAAIKGLHKLTEVAKTKTASKIEDAKQDHTAAEGKRDSYDEAYTAAKEAYDAENERLDQARKEKRKEDWNDIKEDAIYYAWEMPKAGLEKLKGKAKKKIDSIKERAKDKKEAREAAKKARAEEIKRQLEEKKKQEEIARKEAEEKAKKEAARKAKADNRSHKLLNFLTKSVSFVGKDFIAGHLLTEEDKNAYEGVKKAVNEENEIKANKINELLGTTFSAKDLAKMSDKQLARIDKKVQAVQASNERAATNAL